MRNNLFSLRAWIGIGLLLINQPLGWGAVLICNAYAINQHDAFYSLMSLGFYALSWVLFGLGLLLAGKEGLAFSLDLFKKGWLYFRNLWI